MFIRKILAWFQEDVRMILECVRVMAACVQWRAFSESDRYGVWYCLRGVVLRDVVPLVRRRRVPPKGHDPVAPVLKSSRFEVRAPAFEEPTREKNTSA